MNFKDDEEAFNLLNHLMEKFQQMDLKQHGCNFNFVYVASGATHIENQHNYYSEKEKQEGYTDEEVSYPALGLLCQLVKEAVEAGKLAKYILMPQRAAMEAGVMLPPIDADWYNSRFGTTIRKQDISRWIKGTGNAEYDPHDITPIVERFRTLR